MHGGQAQISRVYVEGKHYGGDCQSSWLETVFVVAEVLTIGWFAVLEIVYCFQSILRLAYVMVKASVHHCCKHSSRDNVCWNMRMFKRHSKHLHCLGMDISFVHELEALNLLNMRLSNQGASNESTPCPNKGSECLLRSSVMRICVF